MCPKLMGFTVGPELPDFTKGLGRDAEYMLGSAWWLPLRGWRGPEFGSSQDYGRRVQEKYGEVAGYHIASGTAAGHLLQMAVERAGSTDSDRVRDALLAMDVQIFFGPTK